jgi:hypothetical protein
MSRVFGPLARYALYETVADDDWTLDFDRPREEVWRYVAGHYADLRDRCGFDFMRGDMAHVQMRPDGVPATVGPAYDILASVRDEIRERRGVPSFGVESEDSETWRRILLPWQRPTKPRRSGRSTASPRTRSSATA